MRYRDEDEARLKKTVSDFNRKVRKLEKSGAVAPEKISLTETRKYVQESRQDYNREIKRLERFQRETAAKPHTFKEYGITVTHWEAVEVSRQIAINNRKRAVIKAELDQIPITLRGQPIKGKDGQQLLRAQMQGPEQNAMNPKIVNLNKTYSKTAFKLLQESVKKEAQKGSWTKREAQWQKNYLDALKKEYGTLLTDDMKKRMKNLSPEDKAFLKAEGATMRKDAKALREKIKNMSPKEFADQMRKDQDANISFQYSVMEKTLKMKSLKAIWLPPDASTENLPVKK